MAKAMALVIMVSIHAPRAGRDGAKLAQLNWLQGFNPRAPRGARRASCGYEIYEDGFQSTRPARGATSP